MREKTIVFLLFLLFLPSIETSMSSDKMPFGCYNYGYCNIEDRKSDKCEKCVCDPNFSSGKDCKDETCAAGVCGTGTCNAATRTCSCPTDRYGPYCDYEICGASSCQSTMDCIKLDWGYFVCKCKDTSKTGVNCDETSDGVCSTYGCAAGSSCYEIYKGKAICICPEGRLGEKCDELNVKLNYADKVCVSWDKPDFQQSDWDNVVAIDPQSKLFTVASLAACKQKYEEEVVNNPSWTSYYMFGTKCVLRSSEPSGFRVIDQNQRDQPQVCGHTCTNGETNCGTDDPQYNNNLKGPYAWKQVVTVERHTIQCKQTSCAGYCVDKFDSHSCVNSDEPVPSCKNGGRYIVDPITRLKTCWCLPYYTGIECETYTPCYSSPCGVGAECADINTGDAFTTNFTCHDYCNDFTVNPCKHDGVCVSDTSTPQKYRCQCTADYTGEICENEIKCKVGRCGNGTCEDFFVNSTYNCTCNDGYFGENCEFQYGCSSNPCLKGGTCTNFSGNKTLYNCTCPAGTTGKSCEYDIQCTPSPCLNGGTCDEEFTLPKKPYQCTCPPKYTGTNCEIQFGCASSPCLHGGTCKNKDDAPDQFTCTCKANFTGATCDYKLLCPEAQCKWVFTSECQEDIPGKRYKCICDSDHTGELCTDARGCFAKPCKNGGFCHNDLFSSDPSKYSCDCPPTWTGKNCQTRYHCVKSATRNIFLMWDKTPACENGAKCTELDEAPFYECNCTPDYTSTNCTIKWGCASKPCKRGECIHPTPNADPTLWSCTCPEHYTGQKCELEIKCSYENPCENNGECIDDLKEYGSSYTCNCDNDHFGSRCEKKYGCAGSPCQNQGTCSLQYDETKFTCSCPVNYTGKNCEYQYECMRASCKNGGQCTDDPDKEPPTKTCTCDDKYTGPECENMLYCSQNVCKDGSTCVDKVTNGGKDVDYICDCPPRFTGKNCTEPLLGCEIDDICENNSTCTWPDVKYKENYVCICAPGWTSKNCDESIDDCITPDGNNPCRTKDKTAICTDGHMSFTCQCSDQYVNEKCDLLKTVAKILENFDRKDLIDFLTKMVEDLGGERDRVNIMFPFTLGTLNLTDREEMSWDYDDFFLWAAYEERALDLRRDFFKENDVVFGNCFTFNHRNNSVIYNQRMVGPEGGLKVMAMIDAEEQLPWTETQAIQVFVHNRDESVYLESLRHNAPGFSGSDFQLETTKFTRLGGRYGRCVKDKEEVKAYYYQGVYTTEGCIRSCYQDKVYEKAECMDSRYPKKEDIPACTLKARIAIEEVEAMGDPSSFDGCNCPPPCSNAQTSVRWSVAPFPRDTSMRCSHFKGGSDNRGKCLNGTLAPVLMTIYFPSLAYRILEETEAMTFSRLISNLGGLMGVLMGFCFVFIFEVVYLFITLGRILLNGSTTEHNKSLIDRYIEGKQPNHRQSTKEEEERKKREKEEENRREKDKKNDENDDDCSESVDDISD